MKERELYYFFFVCFELVDKWKISKDINKLDRKKACQEHDIQVKLIIKSNKDFFFNSYTTVSIIPYSVLIFPQT